jgi:multidrug efflux pump subunit AcrA (membrane-fusion protein)
MIRKYGAAAGWLAVVILIAVGIFWGVRYRAALQQAKPAPEKTVQAAKEVTINGRVEAVHVIPVSVAIAGEVDSFSAEVGQDVFEGQVLARISNEGLETGRDNAQRVVKVGEEKLQSLETAISAARLETSRVHTESARALDDANAATKAFERQSLLNREGATPRIAYEKAARDNEAASKELEGLRELARQADERLDALTKEYDLIKKTLEDKRKELEEAEAAVSAAEVHAPAAGIVVARQGEIGKTLTQQEASALFRIATDIVAMQAVFAGDPSMKAGDKVGVSFLDIAGNPIPAVIREIRNGEVVAEFTSDNPAIRPGASCVVHPGIK